MPTALTIAGSDSGGGAGIQADLKTFAAHRVFGTSAITAVTAQNTLGVMMWRAVETDLVTAQIEAVAGDIGADAVKVGMLASAAIVEAVAAAIAELDLPHVVVDPVMVAKGGDRLLEPEAVDAIKAELLPRAHIVTPNVPEAEVLAGIPIRSLEDMRRAGDRILSSAPASYSSRAATSTARNRSTSRARHTDTSSCAAPESTRHTRTGRAAPCRRRSPRTSRWASTTVQPWSRHASISMARYATRPVLAGATAHWAISGGYTSGWSFRGSFGSSVAR